MDKKYSDMLICRVCESEIDLLYNFYKPANVFMLKNLRELTEIKVHNFFLFAIKIFCLFSLFFRMKTSTNFQYSFVISVMRI